MSSTIFHTVPDAAPPPPSARYSHAVQADGWLYVTGQLPVDPYVPDELPPEGIEAQAELCFDNLRRIAAHAGYALSDTVFARIYLREFTEDYPAFNRVYDRYYSDAQRLPARTTIGVAHLGRDARVEIDLVLFSQQHRGAIRESP
jgi:2-iminobutanoate/2-iminopropanoate deaminase